MIKINGVNRASTINDGTTPGTPIGTYHMADNPNIYEIQRINNFEFVVSDIDGIVRTGTSQTYPNAQEIIRMSVISCPIPHFTQNAIEVKRGNTTLKYAGVPSFGAGTIKLNDFIGADSVGVLQAWQNMSYNPMTEKVGHASDYKKTCSLVEYSPDYQVVRTWKLYGCWVSELREDEMNNESNSKHTVSATIQYDRAVLDTSSID